MQPEAILIFSDSMKEYFSETELIEMANMFDVKFEFEDSQPACLLTARRLGEKLDHRNNRRFVSAVIDQSLIRCRERIANTDWEVRSYHHGMLSRLEALPNMINNSGLPTEITVSEDHQFTAKSEAREFLEKAETELFLVDPYIGVGTLDCLRSIQFSIRILTGTRKNSIEPGFLIPLDQFRAEGKEIEIRAHAKLHDRYLVFNDRCWLVGSSLKDAGKKTFNIIEIVDGKSTIVSEIEQKWSEGTHVQ